MTSGYSGSVPGYPIAVLHHVPVLYSTIQQVLPFQVIPEFRNKL
jgi:hypothetical protein